MTNNILHPVSRWNLIQHDQVTKLIERHTAVQEDTAHQVMSTTEKAVRHVLLMLPNSSHTCLHLLAIRHLTYLLEFIYANNDMLSPLYCNLLSHLKHLLRRMCLRCYSQRKCKIRVWLRTE